MVNHDKINLESSQQNFYLIMYLFQIRETRCLSGQHHLVLEVRGVKKLSTVTAMTTTLCSLSSQLGQLQRKVGD